MSGIMLSDSAWRRSIEQFANNYVSSRLMVGLDVEKDIQMFAFTGEISQALIDWIEDHGALIYHHRFPFDGVFINHMKHRAMEPFKSWTEAKDWLKAGNMYIGVNPDSLAVKAAIAKAVGP